MIQNELEGEGRRGENGGSQREESKMGKGDGGSNRGKERGNKVEVRGQRAGGRMRKSDVVKNPDSGRLTPAIT